MLMSVVSACTSTQKSTTEQPSESVSASSGSSLTGTPEPSGSTSTTPTPTPDPLPDSATLVGTKHLPIVDNQGGIGCCSAEAVTYAQFTVAVSQYVNSLDPDSNWDPSSGADEYTFSPKFTYNYSGSGTSYQYEVLKTIGCLPMSLSSHAKSEGSAKFRGGAQLNKDQSRSWDVEAGKMIEALNFRLTDYEENEFTSTNEGKLTTNETGLALLEKIKDAVNRGNCVVVCGWSSYWQTTEIDRNGLGTLGKRGDRIIWNGYKSSASTSDGNHAVTIVGYDDDITVTVGGVTQKGAFQIMNSWGQYANDGFIWMTYDACNVVSEHALYRNEYFYKPVYALSFSGSPRATIPYSANCDIETIFTPVSSVTFAEKEYTTYTLSHKNGKNLVYTEGTLASTDKSDPDSIFALIPYEDVAKKANADYKGSYLLYAVNINQYLSINNYKVELVDKDVVDSKPASVCMKVDTSGKKEGSSFTGMVNTAHMTGSNYNERTGCLYRFSFIYWDEDIAIGAPKLTVEVHVSAVSRDNLYIELTRTDKNSVRDTFIPASTRWRLLENVLPGLGLDQNDTVSFSGKINPTEAEDGYFAFAFDSLADLEGTYSYEDFLWGVNIKGSGITVKGLKLLDENRNVLAEVKTDADTAPLVKGETSEFVFDMGGEVKYYFGGGSYRLKNVGTGKILSANGVGGMLFGWYGEKDKNENLEKSIFNIEYIEDTDSYRFWNNDSSYLFDIFKTTVKDGTTVKLNALNPTRNTQDWTVTLTEGGQIRITLKNYPEYAFGSSDGKNFELSATDQSDNFLWILEPAEPYAPTTAVEEQNGKVVVSVSPIKDYTEGTVNVKIVKDGNVVSTLEGTPDANGMKVETALETGCYLFVVMYNGNEVGTQLIYNVK